MKKMTTNGSGNNTVNNYLFFDIECCNGNDICEFGFVLTDTNFNVIKKEDILINPEKPFRLTGRKNQKDFKLSYPEQKYYAQPKFPTFYEKIKSLIQSKNQIIVGHAIANDAKFLDTACKRFDLNPINFKFADSQKFFAEYYNLNSRVSLQNAITKLELDNSTPLHKGDNDALQTMQLVKKLCDELKVTLSDLIELCPSSRGESKNFKTKFYINTLDYMFYQFEHSPSSMGAKRRCSFVHKFISSVLPEKKILNSNIANKKVCFSKGFQKNNTRNCLVLIQYIINCGGECFSNYQDCDYYIVNSEEELEEVKTISQENLKTETASQNITETEISNANKILYKDFLTVIGLTEDDVKNLKYSKPTEKETVKREEEKPKTSLTSQTGSSIADLLKSKGVDISKLFK